MNIKLLLMMGMLGLVLGCLIPILAKKIIIYKYSVPKNKIHPYELIIRMICGTINAAGWSAISFYSRNPFEILLLCCLWSMAVLIADIDLQVHKIPNETVLIMAVLGSVFQFLHFGVKGFLFAVISMIAVMLCFTVLGAVMGFRTIGAGDVKLAGAMGLALGYPLVLQGLLFMSLLMAVTCVIGIALKKLTLKSMLPFAPFMMAGFAYSILYLLIMS